MLTRADGRLGLTQVPRRIKPLEAICADMIDSKKDLIGAIEKLFGYNWLRWGEAIRGKWGPQLKL